MTGHRRRGEEEEPSRCRGNSSPIPSPPIFPTLINGDHQLADGIRSWQASNHLTYSASTPLTYTVLVCSDALFQALIGVLEKRLILQHLIVIVAQDLLTDRQDHFKQCACLCTLRLAAAAVQRTRQEQGVVLMKPSAIRL